MTSAVTDGAVVSSPPVPPSVTTSSPHISPCPGMAQK
ncbi:Uncharacterised protein [Mycobacteroides abscessus]|nr:Uncharacterised protein [Mycobacteroides abscessus]